ncbi:galactokinase [Aegicerativicinus sediminis]|uniref:galactokinase n=1 Tax=Aegicerativicinus sediminis TaxID=2893202 RepID=UPI001E33F826|nr:galactokinase [Aegicerativicinus sediminis]
MNNELISAIQAAFKMRFGEPEVTVVSPGRINLIGEHTDYNDGFVFPAAIDKSIIAVFAKSTDSVSMIYAYDPKESHAFSLDDVKRIPNGGWRNYVVGVVGEIQKLGKEVPPFNAVFGGDIPAGSGMSSSAALENSIVFGLNELFGLGLSKVEMINVSQKAEHNYVGVRCGIMDQFASMFGEQDHALFLDCRSLDFKAYQVDFGEYGLLLINSNVHHNLAENAYNERRNSCETVAEILNVSALRDADLEMLNAKKAQMSDTDFLKAKYIIEENNRVERAVDYLNNQKIEGFGELLFEAHVGMKDEFEISCAELDFLVELAKEFPGVIGARLMGGGFGGCTINLVDKEQMDDFIELVEEKYKAKFNRECSPYRVNLSRGTYRI